MSSNKQTKKESDLIVMRPIADLVFNPDNPRLASDEDVASLAESIKKNPRFFKARPVILSDRTGVLMIIAGERRTKAALLIGQTEVPTILLSGLSKEEEEEIVIRDNTHAGKWDVVKLQKWNKFSLKRWGVELQKIQSPETGSGDADFEKKFNRFDNSTALYPIVPKYDEDYEVICILCKSSLDANWLRERLGMNMMQSYKRGELGKSNVISFEDVKNALG